MKKITLALAFTGLMAFAQAQEGNNICVYTAMQTYDFGKGDPQDLVRGMKCSDEAIANEATMGKSKTWFYRGKLYSLIATDKTLKTQYGTATMEAVNAFKKLNDLNDPKFKDWEEVMGYIKPLEYNVFNSGIEQFQAKNYSQAYESFYSLKAVNSLMVAKGAKPGIELGTALKNAALSAENAGKAGDSYNVLEELYKLQPDTMSTIVSLAQITKKLNMTDRYNAVVEEGLKKYPKSSFLLSEKINGYLGKRDYKGALVFVNSLLQADPVNDGAWAVKGQAYQDTWKAVKAEADSTKDAKKAADLNAQMASLSDSMLQAYTQATVINAKNITAWTNMGAYYVDRANMYIAKMNKLGNTSEDQKKYDALKKERKDIYLKAKEYLTKAQELDPSDKAIAQTLKQIEYTLQN